MQLLSDTATELQARASRLAGVARQQARTVDQPLTVLVIGEPAMLIAYQPDRDLLRTAEPSFVSAAAPISITYRGDSS